MCEKTIRFICLADAADEPNSDGYWMKLSQWNRYHNDTFKDRRDDRAAIHSGTGACGGGWCRRESTTDPLDQNRLHVDED